MSESLNDSGGSLARMNANLVRFLELLAILAMGILVLDVVWGVATRYLLGEQAKWTEELARFLLIWVSMLGGALAFRRREHLGIDFLVGLMHDDTHRGLRMLKYGIVCLTTVAVFLYGGLNIVFDALAAEQTTPALGWKMGYVYAAVPLAGIFILFFALEEMFSATPHSIDGNPADDENLDTVSEAT